MAAMASTHGRSQTWGFCQRYRARASSAILFGLLGSACGGGSGAGAAAGGQSAGGASGGVSAEASGGTPVTKNSSGGVAGRTEAGGSGAAATTSLPVEVVEVTTITTVQASSGVYLTPEAELTLPAFVERRRTPAVVGDESRSQVDAALLFRGSAPVGLQLDATLSPALSGQNPWSLEWVYPRLEAQTAGLLWRLHVDANAPATEDAQASSEWSGWNVFGGLGVRPASDAAASLPSAPAALVNFSARGPFAPLELRSESTSLIVSNPSPRAVTQALLIYSHSSGVGVRDVRNLGPGERRVTALGPKERAPTELLASAQAMLTAFFAERVGADLAATIAASKSIPFLETPGLRLVYLLDEVDSPFALEFSPHVARARRVLVAHAEVLSSFDEANALALLANDPTLDSKSASAALGRFTEAKLELAVSNGNPEVSARAAALLSDLRAQ